MVNGTVQEKNGLLYTVISYYDKDGVRRQKWQTTGLDARGNLRKAKEILKERIDDMENELVDFYEKGYNRYLAAKEEGYFISDIPVTENNDRQE